MQKVESIEFVEYHDGFAQSIAEMWNESRDNWGGDTSIMTAEQVKEKEANSDDLFLFLALKNEKVIGYCGISEYKEDKGALYIRLLNVHPEYQGLKIGKKLVLLAVQKTIELGWPRIDLYTWAGNTKAVPLYKKCGFFWENRDDTTHLMNFIPLVLQNEIIKPYFDHLDWYEDIVRAIDVKPDGLEENGFTFYEYVWKRASYFIRVQIERSGRGIRLIETNDFFFEAKLNEHTQIEGSSPLLHFHFINKSSHPMEVSIDGIENERVLVKENKKVMVDSEKKFSFPFTILEGQDPNEWVTHPCVEANITINGRIAPIKVGLSPKKALMVNAVWNQNLYQMKRDQCFYLEFENHLSTNTDICIEFTNDSILRFEQSQLFLSLKSKAKGILQVPVIIEKYGFFQSEITLKVIADDHLYEWKEVIGFPLPHFGVKSGGSDKEYYYLQNGYYRIMVRKRDNAISFGHRQKFGQRTMLQYPKLGKPFFSELSKKQATSFTWEQSDHSAIMKIKYEVTKPYLMNLFLCFEIYGEGLVKYWLELKNKTNHDVGNVYIYQPIFHEINKTYMPLENRVVFFNNSKKTGYGDISSNDLTGNWIFSIDDIEPHGISWNQDMKVGFDGWLFHLEEMVQKVRVNQNIETKPMYFSIGAIKTVNDFIKFVDTNKKSEIQISEDFFILPKSNNPIISYNQTIELTVTRFQNNDFDGEIVVMDENKNCLGQSVQFDSNDELKINISSLELGLIPLQYVLNRKSEKRLGSILILKQNNEKIKTNILEENNHKIFEIQNHELVYRVAPGFFPALYSLKLKGKEWFDSTYPTPGPRAWWNPWAGGMRSYLNGLSLFSILNEDSIAHFTKKTDQLGNIWNGIVIETKVEKNDKWNGLVSKQYFMTLPGIPIVGHFSELSCSNRVINNPFQSEIWVKRNTLTDTTIYVQEEKSTHQLKAGFEEHIFNSGKTFYFKDQEEEQIMQVLYNFDPIDTESVFSKDFALTSTMRYANVEPSQTYISEPIFLLFPKHQIDRETLENLKFIQF